MSLVLFDIDRFKEINDRFGHLAGDGVLIRLVEVIQGYLRTGHTVARVGGEEFAVICPETEEVGAIHLAERLRACVASITFDGCADEERFSISCSFGIAQLDETMDQEAFFSAADGALYRAKRGGRNRTCAA